MGGGFQEGSSQKGVPGTLGLIFYFGVSFAPRIQPARTDHSSLCGRWASQQRSLRACPHFVRGTPPLYDEEGRCLIVISEVKT